MESVRLKESALQIKLAEQLPEHRAFVAIASGVAGLADGHPQRG
jgi:hypothetical protein